VTYPASPEPDELETVEALAEANPMPDALKKQIGNWIEPQTMSTYMDHGDAMDCVEIAFPLIRAWLAEHPEDAA
jgi:hypothetical protein